MEEKEMMGLEEAYTQAALEESYRQLATEYDCGMGLVLAKIENIRKQMELRPERSPFAYVESRMKTFSSVLRKCVRRGYAENESGVTLDLIKLKVRDIAGIRVTTTFQDDIFKVRDLIVHQPGINVVEEKDYVTEHKDNGYSSLHLNIQNEIYSISEGTSKLVPVEIQIRDRAQDLWATIEHIVAYKKLDRSPEAEELFRRMSETLDGFDMLAMELRDYHSDATDGASSES